MHLGYYYHVPGVKFSDGIKFPAYVGVFIKALIENTESVTLFIHENESKNPGECDFLLQDDRLKIVSLGNITPAWNRFIFPWRTLRKIKNEVYKTDLVLVRAPSPLAPYFYKYFRNKSKICYLVVGDYLEGAESITQPWYRRLPIKVLLKRNDRQLEVALSKTLTLVNSFQLFDRYKEKAFKIFKVSTATLSESDFWFREDSCLNSEIRLLFVGRLDLAKGLRELIEATANLASSGVSLVLQIVGGEENKRKPLTPELFELATRLDIGDRVYFRGLVPFGHELNSFYRGADIFIMPSYHEGFPRVIWEAMANGLPVISTSVGSIPYELTDSETALLIPPKSSESIVSAVNRIVQNSQLRKVLIRNGYRLAQRNTLSEQAQNLCKIFGEELGI